jgi:hypothetical protein
MALAPASHGSCHQSRSRCRIWISTESQAFGRIGTNAERFSGMQWPRYKTAAARYDSLAVSVRGSLGKNGQGTRSLWTAAAAVTRSYIVYIKSVQSRRKNRKQEVNNRKLALRSRTIGAD